MLRASIILFGIMLSSSVLAGTENEASADKQFLIGLSAGPTWASGNKTQTLFLQPDVEKTYTESNDGSAFGTGELFVALQKPLPKPFMSQLWMSQLGISFVGAGTARLNGDIWEDADPAFDNFNYNYKVNHAHVAIKGRLIDLSCRIFQPYISGSIGVGFNHAYDFTINPIIPEEVAAPPFSSNTTTSFVYTLGIGLQKSLNKQLQVGIGYEFADWGKTQLGRAPGQTVNQGLSLNHLYAQQLQFSLFYII